MSDTLFDTFVPTGVTLKAGAAPVANPASSGITTSSHPPSAPDSSSVGSPAGTDSAASVRPGTPSEKAPAGDPPAEPARGATAEDGWGYFPPNVSEQERPIFGYMAETMKNEGVPTNRGSEFLGWLRELDSAPAPNEEKAHRYNVGRFQWAEEDEPHLNAYLNRAHAAGWTQQEVEQAIRWWKTTIEPHVARDRAAAQQEITKRDAADAKAGARALRLEWGEAAAPNFRVLREYVGKLPQSEREALEQAQLPNGRRALNDPATIKALVAKATSANGMTLEEIRHVMRTDRKKYNASEAMQARYRELLRGQAA